MAKKQEERTIILDNGEVVKATFPIVVSASRSTDIPAFYSDWFFERLKKGYSAWTNPFNGKKSYVAYEDTRFIVFWSKNPRSLLNHIDYLRERGIGCYIQYTLNDYEEERLEQGVPSLKERIETFKLLANKLGKGAVVWRFDPLILTDKIDIDKLLQKIERIGDQLQGYTEKLVFSFADILSYRKVKANLERNHINYIDWSKEQMMDFSQRLVSMNKAKGWNYILATCGEVADLDGVEHNHCVDDRLMVRFGYKSNELMNFLGVEIINPTYNLFAESDMDEIPQDAICLGNNQFAVINKNNKDKGQRAACGCMKSKDIGEYNTCPHLCEYCYANASKELAIANWRRHQLNTNNDTITGK
ncbi:DUF1848 domain-containing protein [Lepagella muris]|jgi:DNA repair photolyase|uniref:DUF1848 domain-containing protein n=1 Tax=Lepagella muris TaxID=3032870 RepID=A0AC61RI09_9BACT|nr:DUF1848 domain-containing protein [Lepagella muris]ROT06067.1 DUF1848 domain-containing protein [Muribaculaceae bacterium Isolate-037 (Harlan)]TGY80598.1 DUF1848 domain-containing protein [Lepagella muris]THG53495.1 DUF1848 domain-containing protein [Bacteroidales bacterium]TKC55703.1 DUF1848 domain-containing protein [Bacteroidales bacterium]